MAEKKKSEETPGKRPEWNIVQSIVDKDGVKSLKSVGGIWMAKTKTGDEMMSIRLGNAEFLGFRSKPRED